MLKRKKPDPNYKPEDDYTWPVMARKMAQWEKNAQRPKTPTESYRMEIMYVRDEIKKKESASGNGAQDME